MVNTSVLSRQPVKNRLVNVRQINSNNFFMWCVWFWYLMLWQLKRKNKHFQNETRNPCKDVNVFHCFCHFNACLTTTISQNLANFQPGWYTARVKQHNSKSKKSGDIVYGRQQL